MYMLLIFLLCCTYMLSVCSFAFILEENYIDRCRATVVIRWRNQLKYEKRRLLISHFQGEGYKQRGVP